MEREFPTKADLKTITKVLNQSIMLYLTKRVMELLVRLPPSSVFWEVAYLSSYRNDFIKNFRKVRSLVLVVLTCRWSDIISQGKTEICLVLLLYIVFISYLLSRFEVTVHSQHMVTDFTILFGAKRVCHNEEQIETRQKRIWQSNILLWSLRFIVISINRIGSCKYATSSVQTGVDSCFRNGHCLLFHDFMDCHSIDFTHFIKFVNANDTTIGLQNEITCNAQLELALQSVSSIYNSSVFSSSSCPQSFQNNTKATDCSLPELRWFKWIRVVEWWSRVCVIDCMKMNGMD